MEFLAYLSDPLQYSFFVQALIASVLVMTAAGLSSFTIVSNNQSFFTQGISQAMVLGVAVGAGNFVGGLAGAFLAALATASVIVAIQNRLAWLPSDAVIAAISSLVFASGIVVLNAGSGRNTPVSSVLFGNVLGVSSFEIAILLIFALMSIGFFGFFGKRLQLIAQNRTVALAAGIKVRELEYARIIWLALLTAVAVPVVGVLLVVSATVIPALIGVTFTPRKNQAYLIAGLSATLSALLGLYASYFLDTPTGPTIALSLGALWVIFALTALTKGLIRT